MRIGSSDCALPETFPPADAAAPEHFLALEKKLTHRATEVNTINLLHTCFAEPNCMANT
jgi:hypothetical protein